jgi:hypothetical protein
MSSHDLSWQSGAGMTSFCFQYQEILPLSASPITPLFVSHFKILYHTRKCIKIVEKHKKYENGVAIWDWSIKKVQPKMK